MNSQAKTFQTILLLVLGVGLVVGLMIFGGVIKVAEKGNKDTVGLGGSVTIWGPFTESGISNFFNEFADDFTNVSIRYEPKNPETYDEDLLEALASGNVPDIVILPHTMIARYQDKLSVIPPETLSDADFRSLYSSGAEIFRTPLGTTALPLGVDPLVMYYNQNMLESAGFALPPLFWNTDFLSLIQDTTKVEADGITIAQSGAALGATSNITHAEAIISAIGFQLGSAFTQFEEGIPRATFTDPSLVSNAPIAGALDFFVRFTNASDEYYTWNTNLPEALDAFAFETSATYFGFASELLTIQRKNPNLNFNVTKIPQLEEVNRTLTYGNFYGLAIPKTAPNIASAFSIAGALSGGTQTSAFLETLSLQPARRDLLAQKPDTLYEKVFLDSAIIARGWITPRMSLVETIFASMVADVSSGRLTTQSAVRAAEQKINEAF